MLLVQNYGKAVQRVRIKRLLRENYKSIEENISTTGQGHQDAQYWLFTLDYGKRITRASIDWCESTINKIS